MVEHTWTYWNEGSPVVENQGFDCRASGILKFSGTSQVNAGSWSYGFDKIPGRFVFYLERPCHWEHVSDLERDWAFECMDVVFCSS